jgi:hypothetical protein
MLPFDAKILNISLGGLELECEKQLLPDMQYPVKLVNGKRNITLNGLVVRSQITCCRQVSRTQFSPVYVAGIRFLDAGGRAAEIEEFIKDNMEQGPG